LAGAFLAVDFFAVDFLVDDLLAGAFLAADFLAGALLAAELRLVDFFAVFLAVEPPLLEAFLAVEPPLLEAFLAVEPPLLEAFFAVEPPLLEAFFAVDLPLLEAFLAVDLPLLEAFLAVFFAVRPVSRPVSSSSPTASSAVPLSRLVQDSIREVAVFRAAVFAAPASRPVTWSRSALTSLFPSTLALWPRSTSEPLASLEPASRLPTVIASFIFLVLPSR